MANIQDTASLFLKVNGEEAKKKFEEVKAKVTDLKNQLKEASKAGDFKKVEEIHKQLKPAVKEMDSMLTRIGRIDAAMKNLSLQTPKELRRTIALINAEMNSGAIEVGSKEWKEYEQQLQKVKSRLKELDDAQKVVTKSGMTFKDMLDIGGNISMVAAAVIGMKDSVAGFVRDNVDSYIELDAEMANVQKFTGMTRQSVEELNEEFKKIDTRTSVVELNKLAEEAGRLGKTSKEDVLGFVKAADIINVALDDLGEGATLEISKLTSIFGDEKALGTEKSMLAVGSVINELSQNCTAAAPYLANFTKRLAGVGAQADMTIPQIMGFAAVLDSQGQAVEMSATAVSQLITKMFQDPAKIAKAVGMDVKEFTDMVKTDTNGALLTLLERLNAFGNMDVLAPIFKEMGTDGARASAVLASLAGNVDMVRQQQEVATEAYKEATSVVKEFSVQNETEEAKLEKKRKKLEEVKVALGEKLLPIMGGFTSTGTMMIKTLNASLDVFNEYKATIISTGSAVLAYTAFVKAKNFVTAHSITLRMAKIVLLRKSRLAWMQLKAAMAGNLWGIAIVAVTAIIGLFIDYNRRLDKVSAGERALGKIREEANKKAAEEEARLKALLKVAEDENASLESRKKAIDALNQIIPDYNAQLDETTGQYTANADALIRYNEALKKKYELEGAKDMLAELGREKARLYTEKETAKIDLDNAVTLSKMGNYTGGREGRMMNTGTGANIAFKQQKLNEIEAQLNSIAKKEETIFGAYGKDLGNSFAEDIINNNPTGNGGGGTGTGDQSDAIKEWRDKEEAINRMAYYTGQKTYEEYCKRKNEILIEFYDKQLADTSLKENDRLKIEADKVEELHKQQVAANNKTLDENLKTLDKKKKDEEDAVIKAFINREKIEEGDEQKLREQLFQINRNYLDDKKALYLQYAKDDEAAKIAASIEKQDRDEQLRKHNEYLRLLNDYRRRYDKLSIAERKDAELTALQALYQEELMSEEEYQQKKKAIKEKYRGEEEREANSVSDGGGWGDKTKDLYYSISDIIDSITEKGELGFEDIGRAAESAFAIAGSALQLYSNYFQAECDLEVAKIEKKYDAQIKAAGKNDKKVKQLEEQRDKEIAKVKSKANKKAMKIEIAQAVAQTAMAAINAYASAAAVPGVGYILGPIAAAMATAAGMMQIATIKKQHQAQELGYYKGGWTRRSNNDHDEVGVVHANEFVVNARATANPAVVPFLNLIDYAQRNNTESALTADDVSHSLGTGAVVSATATTAKESAQGSGELLLVAASMQTSAQAIERLNTRLDDGIESYMVMDGERGFDKKYNEYLKLTNNSKR